jgi:hypothetical protein
MRVSFEPDRIVLVRIGWLADMLIGAEMVFYKATLEPSGHFFPEPLTTPVFILGSIYQGVVLDHRDDCETRRAGCVQEVVEREQGDASSSM